jgi:hypothetical protein
MEHRFTNTQHRPAIPQPRKEWVKEQTPDAGARCNHTERLLDDALADTFPCSDPVSTLYFQ